MISEWLKVLFGKDYAVKGMVPEDVNANYFKQQSRSLKLLGVKSVHLRDVIKHIKNNERYLQYLSYLNNIQKRELYKSDIHGLSHNERVSIFAFYLADKLWLKDKDLNLIMLAAFYHDIGRSHDYFDEYHGTVSADKLDGLGLDLTQEDIQILKTIITAHSYDDSRFKSILDNSGVKDVKRCEKLFQILKDCDALDRVRLINPVVMPNYLRHEESKELILAAYQLMVNYRHITSNLQETETREKK